MRILSTILLLTAMPLYAAQTLRICVDEQPLPPYTYPDREGIAQRWVSQAASQLGWEIRFTHLPLRRCHAGVTSGLYQGAMLAFRTPSITSQMVLPQQDGSNDVQRSFGVLRAVAFRVRGTTAEWDGKQFRNVSRPVLYSSGIKILHDQLETLGVRADESAKSTHQLMQMLLAGRAEIALSAEYQVHQALQDPTLEERIEVLSPAFLQKPAYLGFSKSFYAAYPKTAEGIWDLIGHLRQQACPRATENCLPR